MRSATVIRRRARGTTVCGVETWPDGVGQIATIVSARSAVRSTMPRSSHRSPACSRRSRFSFSTSCSCNAGRFLCHGPFETRLFNFPVSNVKLPNTWTNASRRDSDASSASGQLACHRCGITCSIANLPPRHPLTAQPGRLTGPTASMVFDRFEHHPKATPLQPRVRRQPSELPAHFVIIGPIRARSGLMAEEVLDNHACRHPIRTAQRLHEIDSELAVRVRRARTSIRRTSQLSNAVHGVPHRSSRPGPGHCPTVGWLGGDGPGSAGGQELLDPLMRESQELGGVAAAQAQFGERLHRIKGLLLGLGAGSLGSGPRPETSSATAASAPGN